MNKSEKAAAIKAINHILRRISSLKRRGNVDDAKAYEWLESRLNVIKIYELED